MELIFQNQIDALIDAGEQPQENVEDTEVSEDTGLEDSVEVGEDAEQPEGEGTEDDVIKFEVDGEVIETTYEELLATYKDTATIKKQNSDLVAFQQSVNQILTEAKSNPWSLIERLGFNPEELAVSYIEKSLAEETEALENPDKREIRRLRKEQEDLRKAQEEARKAQEQAQKLREAEEWGNQIEQEILATLAQNGITKPTPRLIGRIAEAMLNDLNNGAKPDAKNSFKRAKSSISQDVVEYVNSVSVENLLASMDKDTVESFRKFFLNKAKSPFKSEPKVSEQVTKGTQQRQSLEDIFGKTNNL